MPRKKRIEKPVVVEEPLHTGGPPAELAEHDINRIDTDVPTTSTQVVAVPDEPLEEEGSVVAEPPKTAKPSGMVKVKVLAGTLGWSGGYYEKGEIFEISKKDLKRFDPRYYKIIK